MLGDSDGKPSQLRLHVHTTLWWFWNVFLVLTILFELLCHRACTTGPTTRRRNHPRTESEAWCGCVAMSRILILTLHVWEIRNYSKQYWITFINSLLFYVCLRHNHQGTTFQVFHCCSTKLGVQTHSEAWVRQCSSSGWVTAIEFMQMFESLPPCQLPCHPSGFLFNDFLVKVSIEKFENLIEFWKVPALSGSRTKLMISMIPCCNFYFLGVHLNNWTFSKEHQFLRGWNEQKRL